MQLEDINTKDINTISRPCLEQRLQQGNITLLMTESCARFQLGHIPGSQCFSVALLAHLPREKPVVLYAAHYPSLVTQWAYWLLLEREYTGWLYVGGLREWQEAGCPLQKVETATLDNPNEVKQ